MMANNRWVHRSPVVPFTVSVTVSNMRAQSTVDAIVAQALKARLH